MFVLKAVYCRAFQAGFRIALPFLPYRQPRILSSCADLGAELTAHGVGRVLLVTDKGIVQSGLSAKVEHLLTDAGIHCCVYSDTLPNPTVQNVEAALDLYRTHNCNGLVAVGGGSSIDCAKAVGARAACPNRTLKQLGGKLKLWRKIPPLAAIPTTAGTGSEATLAALVTDPDTHHKYALMSFPLIPHCAVLDPDMTRSLPAHLTATTGMDALTHAVEAFIGQTTTKLTRRLSLEATASVFRNIEQAFRNGNDLSARDHMLHAAYKAGFAFSMSYVGYAHAIAHSLGGRYGTPHGLANAVILPYVLEAYGPCIHKKLHRLGAAAGVCAPDCPHSEGAQAFIQAIKALNQRMGIPTQLSGIRFEDVPALARHAEREANPLYPVPKLMTRKQLERLYYQIADRSETT